MDLNKKELDFCLKGACCVLAIWLACELGWFWTLVLFIGGLCCAQIKGEDKENLEKERSQASADKGTEGDTHP